VNEYAKFNNQHYELVEQIDDKVTKHGHPNIIIEDTNINLADEVLREIDGVNLLQFFSLAKKSLINRSENDLQRFQQLQLQNQL